MTRILIALALLITFNAHAAAPITDEPSLTPPVSEAQASFAKSHDSLPAALQTAADSIHRREILGPLLLSDPANAVYVMALVSTQTPTIAQPVFNDIVALLGENPDHRVGAAVQQLADAYPNLTDALADTIAPAAGPEHTVTGNDMPAADNSPQNIPLENPNQISGNRP